jgi:hypothetical protein
LLHQQDVTRLAVRLGVDQCPCRALGRCQLRAAQRQPSAPDQFKRLQAQVLELAATRLEPGSLVSGQQPPHADVERNLRQRPGPLWVAVLERSSRALDAGRRGFEVNPDGLRQREHQLLASEQRGGSERGAQAREQRPQGGVLCPWRLLWPQCHAQLFASNMPVPPEHHVGEQQRDLPAPERGHPLVAVNPHGQAAAKLDAGPLWRSRLLRQRFGNVAPTADRHPADV